MAQHYNIAILPARIRKPRDKAYVENAVGVASTWIIAALRNEQFLTLLDAKLAVNRKLRELNARPYTKRGGTRSSAVGRKNWMMIATESGAKANAMLYSIVETCKANRIKIYEYFKLLLTVLPEHENDTDTTYLDSLLPWSQDLPESCKLPEQLQKKKKKK